MSYVCKKHDEFVPDGQTCRWCEPDRIVDLLSIANGPDRPGFVGTPVRHERPTAEQIGEDDGKPVPLGVLEPGWRRVPGAPYPKVKWMPVKTTPAVGKLGIFEVDNVPLIEDLPWSGVGPKTSEEVRREERMLDLGRVFAKYGPAPQPVLDQRNAEPVAMGGYRCPRCGELDGQWFIFWVPKGSTLPVRIEEAKEDTARLHDQRCPGLIQAKDAAGWPLRDGPEGA